MTAEFRVVVQQLLHGLHPLDYPLRVVKSVHAEKEPSALGQVLQETANSSRDFARGHLLKCLRVGANRE